MRIFRDKFVFNTLSKAGAMRLCGAAAEIAFGFVFIATKSFVQLCSIPQAANKIKAFLIFFFIIRWI